ncbi:MAG: AAA family ATPase, partial [Thermodesulfobacteriota bacterium]
MADVLVCWIGNTDLKAAVGDPAAGLGPIGRAVAARPFDAVHLLSDYPDSRSAPYAVWLRTQTSAPVRVRAEPLSGPTRFGEIYEAAVRGVTEALEAAGPGARLAFHLSPGTPAMAAVWILLAKTRFPAELIESSPQEGVVTASVPFDLSADFLPDLLRRPDRELERLSQGLPPEAPEFADILHRSP